MHGDIDREIVPSFQSKLAESVEANEILEFECPFCYFTTMIFGLIISICNKSFNLQEECCDICGDIGASQAILNCRQCKTSCEHMYDCLCCLSLFMYIYTSVFVCLIDK